jgi:hypothetical protein
LAARDTLGDAVSLAIVRMSVRSELRSMTSRFSVFPPCLLAFLTDETEVVLHRHVTENEPRILPRS